MLHHIINRINKLIIGGGPHFQKTGDFIFVNAERQYIIYNVYGILRIF